MVSDIANTDIPSNRMLTYRRNTLATSCVLALLYWYPTINFGDLSFFGVRPPAGSDQRALVFRMLWALLCYHLVFFGYYAWRDWRRWLKIAERVDHAMMHTRDYPELGMYFGRSPKRTVNRASMDGNVKRDWKFQYNPDNQQFCWSEVNPPLAAERGDRVRSYAASRSDVVLVREAVIWFVANDLGVPIFIVVSCVLLAIFS